MLSRQELVLGGKHVSLREKIENQKGQKKTASVLGGIHYQDSRGMLRINPSDAFSVLLTFSPSPKRHVVCQRAFIKLDRRGKQCGGRKKKKKKAPALHRDESTGYHRQGVSCFRASGAAPLGTFLEKWPFSSLDLGLRGESMRSGEECADVAHHSRAAYSLA